MELMGRKGKVHSVLSATTLLRSPNLRRGTGWAFFYRAKYKIGRLVL